MNLISITHAPDTGKVSYGFTFGNEVKSYSANVSDSDGIRGVTCEPDLDALLLEAQAKNSNAVKILIKATWDFIDGVSVPLPLVL